MELGKRMNKDKVEFIFEPKFSPLKRNSLSKEIKGVIQVKNLTKQLEQESKIEILNYLLNSLLSTTNSITQYFLIHPKQSIDELLNEFNSNSNDNSNSNQVMTCNYNQIPANTKKEAFNLIKENSDIRKDNYSIMFDVIKLHLEELINPKPKNNKHPLIAPKTSRKSQPDPNIMIKGTKYSRKTLSKTFNLSINLNDSSSINAAYNINKSKIRQKECKIIHSIPSSFIPSFSKNGMNGMNDIDFSLELRSKVQDEMMKDVVFKNKMNERLKKKQKKASKKKQMKKNSINYNSPKYSTRVNNTLLNVNNPNKSQSILNDSMSPQKNKSEIIYLKKTHGIPVPLGAQYQEPKNSIVKNSINGRNYSNSNYHCNGCIKEEETKNKTYNSIKNKSNFRIQKKHNTSISSSSEKKKKEVMNE